MRSTKVLTGAGTLIETFQPKTKYNEDGIVQIQIGGTATVSISGRLSPTAPWVDIDLDGSGTTSVTASGYYNIPLFPQMRITSVSTSGINNIWIID